MNDLPNTLIIIAFVVVFVGIFGYSVYRNKKRKSASWSGVVIDKSTQEHVHHDNDRRDNQGSGISVGGVSFGNSNRSDVAVTHSYSISVRPEGGGEVFNWDISSGVYETVAIGDTVVKRPGTTTPEITTKATTATDQPAPTNSAQ